MQDMIAVMDAAQIEDAAFFAVSEGAAMALLFAATYPERVRALAIYGGYARIATDDDYRDGVDPGGLDKMSEYLLDNWADGVMAHLFLPDHADDPAAKEAWAKLLRSGASPSMGIATLRAMFEIDVRDVLPAIRVPTLVVHRTGDRAAPVELARNMAERIPGSKYVELPGNDHLWFTGDGEAIFDLVEEFFTGKRRQANIDRALATVLFTDIVDSTARAAELGDRAWRSLVERHDDVVRGKLADYCGREIKTMGDGFLATFDGPARALTCATGIRDDVRPLGLSVRAGLHTGELEFTSDNDVSGMAVNIAARVSALAGADEVLASSTVKDLVVGSGIEFEPRGATELKGVPGEWPLYAVVN
jgi:class 3 adenylate cyclase